MILRNVSSYLRMFVYGVHGVSVSMCCVSEWHYAVSVYVYVHNMRAADLVPHASRICAHEVYIACRHNNADPAYI